MIFETLVPHLPRMLASCIKQPSSSTITCPSCVDFRGVSSQMWVCSQSQVPPVWPERQNNGTEHRALKKFLCIRSSVLWQGCQEYTVWKDNLFSKRCWEKWVSTWPKNEITHLIYTYTKIHSQWVNDLNIRPQTIKSWKKTWGNPWWHWSWPWLHAYDTKSTGNRKENQQVGPY